MSNEASVSVRLTQAGQKAAGSGPLYVHGGATEVAFRGAEPQTVSITLWDALLKTTAPAGEPFFETVKASTPPPKRSAPEPTDPEAQ